MVIVFGGCNANGPIKSNDFGKYKQINVIVGAVDTICN